MAITSFEDFKLNKQIRNAVEELGFTTPTPIQERAIPLLTAGHDLLGIAQTGTGKTAAFTLPILYKLKYSQGDHARVLILAPTRELVIQIAEHATLLAKYTDLRIVSLYGGIGPKTQIQQLQDGVDIIVSTPGRFWDLYDRGEINVRSLKTMVMDEADKMLDMGFLPQINRVLEVIPTKRQNMLFSATMSDKVIRLTEDFLEFPEKVEVTPQATTVDLIDQSVVHLPNFRTKLSALQALLEQEDKFPRVIVFCKTKKNAEAIGKYLERLEIGSIRIIHANKGQSTRLNAYEQFKQGDIRILVATDVASRGIDVAMVSHVINFDIPIVYEDYVHRVGRTGRAQNEGEAITFCNEAEVYHLRKIEGIINKKIDVKKLDVIYEVFETPKDERQTMAREIDRQKRKEDPTFKGAFHEKKRTFVHKDHRSYKSKDTKRAGKTRNSAKRRGKKRR